MKIFPRLHGKALLIAVIVSAFYSTLSDANDVHFEHISIEQGLSQTSVFSVFQDSKGFMWFGTLDGLNKYDGYSFTVYKSDPRNPNTLSNNTIVKIFEDKQGYLWIGTLGGGLNKFDEKTEQFTRYRNDPRNSTSLSNDNVRSIFQDAGGHLWIGTNNGLNRYAPENDRFIRYGNIPYSLNSLSNNVIWSIYESPADPGILWIGTYDGLNKFDVAKNAYSVYKNIPGDNASISNNYIWSIIEDDTDHLWIGSNNGLNLFDKKHHTFERFTHDAHNPHSIGGNNVWTLWKDRNGTVFAGTLDGGLNKIVRSNTGRRYSFINYTHDPSDPGSLSHDFVWSIYEDRTGIIWLGTDVGINKLNPDASKFVHFKSEPYKPHSLSNNEITAIFRDHTGVLWIGTRNGLNRYDEQNNVFVHFINSSRNRYSISNNFIRSIYEDKHGTLWIGTNGGGLNKYIRSKNIFYNMKNGNITSGISSNDITHIHEDADGTLWLGTLAGLNKFDPATGKVKMYVKEPNNPRSLSHDYVYTMYETRDHTLWVGTLGGGLNKFDREKESFTQFIENPADTSSLSNNNIWCIYESTTGDMWVGTNNGLDKFNRTNGTFSHYNEKNGLVNNVIYGILEDDKRNLWLSSNKGLSRFNPASGVVRNYTSSDGLQSNQFGGNDYLKDSRGYMYFGGINGFNVFFPDSIKDNPHIPPIVITDFQILNRSVGIGGGSPFSRSISGTTSITLAYSQNVFSIEFAALHYSSPQSNTYAYKMEGFDKEWTSSGTRRFVTYTNLDPGKYIFTVIGSNNDGIWNTDGTSIEIIISPPFWKTWWFISFVAAGILSIIASIVYIQFRHLLAIERLRVKIASDLHDDIGTRLTEISLLSDMVYHVETEDLLSVKKSVRNIGGIARALIENMSDIVWLINPKRDSLFELFIKLKDGYDEILSYRQILLHINNFHSMEKVFLTMEFRKNVYLIFKEAINNAIKHSNCSEISINAEIIRKHLTITMYDNGKGFDATKRSNGNGLENMHNRATAIGGSLRIQSSAENGSMIKFSGKI
jgi:ligand-binding sensor domain-containing protein